MRKRGSKPQRKGTEEREVASHKGKTQEEERQQATKERRRRKRGIKPQGKAQKEERHKATRKDTEGREA